MQNRLIPVMLILVACKSPGVVLVNAENKVVSRDIKEDNVTNQLIAPWKDSVRRSMSAFAGISDTVWMQTNRTGNLGQLVADAGMESARKFMLDSLGFIPHCAVFNFGGLRNSLPKDSIFYRDIFSCLPFDNEVLILHLRGSTMDSLLNLIASRKGEPVSSISLVLKNNTWREAEINNLPFDSRREYWVVVNDFMANGGDGFTMLQHPLNTLHTGIGWRKALTALVHTETEKYGVIKKRNSTRISMQ